MLYYCVWPILSDIFYIHSPPNELVFGKAKFKRPEFMIHFYIYSKNKKGGKRKDLRPFQSSIRKKISNKTLNFVYNGGDSDWRLVAKYLRSGINQILQR